jgi:hypothetical protein
VRIAMTRKLNRREFVRTVEKRLLNRRGLPNFN